MYIYEKWIGHDHAIWKYLNWGYIPPLDSTVEGYESMAWSCP